MTYEILQDGIVVAAADDPRDALHYAVVYSRDAPVTVRDTESLQRMIDRFPLTADVRESLSDIIASVPRPTAQHHDAPTPDIDPDEVRQQPLRGGK